MNYHNMEEADYRAMQEAEAESEAQYLMEQEAAQAEAESQMNDQQGEYDYITPPHYKDENGEDYIDRLEKEEGIVRAYYFCIDTAGKYKYRMGKKPGEPSEREQKKIQEYLSRAEKLKEKLL